MAKIIETKPTADWYLILPPYYCEADRIWGWNVFLFYFQQNIRIRIILSLLFVLSKDVQWEYRSCHCTNRRGQTCASALRAQLWLELMSAHEKTNNSWVSPFSPSIYRFTHHGVPLIVKLFAPQALSNYEQELACLRCACHPSIFKVLYHRCSIDASSTEPLVRSHVIVMDEATRGDLNDYLPRYGKMT
jgi:hypothetical protein